MFQPQFPNYPRDRKIWVSWESYEHIFIVSRKKEENSTNTDPYAYPIEIRPILEGGQCQGVKAAGPGITLGRESNTSDYRVVSKVWSSFSVWFVGIATLLGRHPQTRMRSLTVLSIQPSEGNLTFIEGLITVLY